MFKKRISQKIFVCLALSGRLLLPAGHSVHAVEPALVQIGNHAFRADDFEYVYSRNNLDGNLKPEECFSQYISCKLKLIAAKEAGIDTLPSFIREWTKYRDMLAGKYLWEAIVSEEVLKEAYERSLWEINAAQIVLRVSGSDSLTVRSRIMQIRRRILDGEDFGDMAEQYSEDPPAKTGRGQMGFLSVFKLPYPVETAVYTTETGGVSMPVRSDAGYHIVKVYGRRSSGYEGTFGEAKADMQQRLINSNRLSYLMDAYIRMLKGKYGFTENISLLEYLSDENQYTNYANLALFSFAGRDCLLSDFKQALGNDAPTGFSLHVAEQEYKKYVAETLLNHESGQLESNNGDFRAVVREYHDGLLLVKISENETDAKIMQESRLLEDFYAENAKSYKWKKRMDATVYYCADAKVADRISQIVHNKNAAGGPLPQGLYTLFCNSGGISPCIDTVRVMLSKGGDTAADRIQWKKGCSKVLKWKGKFVFLDVHEIFRPARKTFKEARGEVLADCRNELERKWVEQLKEKYPVTVNEPLWAQIREKYVK
jgi:hypothetical protein